MCGRYSFSGKGLARFESALNVALPELEPRFNIAPSQDNPVILQASDGYVLEAFRWGLVPHWSKEPRTKYSTINTKVETVAQKPFYKESYRHRRCLVLADGYYEWEKAGDRKQPYYIHQGGQAFAFAGLWDRWEGKGAEPFSSYTIITGPAAAAVKDIHIRMPLVLPESAWRGWLDPETPTAELSGILEAPETEFQTYPISTRVNNPRNEGPELIRPL